LPSASGRGISWQESDDGNTAGRLAANASRGTLELFNGGVSAVLLSGSADSYVTNSLGIGTTSPATKLHLTTGTFYVDNGSITISNVGVDSDWTAYTGAGGLLRAAGPTAFGFILGTGNNAVGGSLYLGKTRSSETDGNTVVQSGDNIGTLFFTGSSGLQYSTYASIEAEADGASGNGDAPARLLFKTAPDGSAQRLERMRIDNAGNVRVSAGGTSSTATVGGTLHYQDYLTSVTTTTPAGTNIVAFSSYTLPGGLIAKNGDCIVAKCWGSTANNTVNKTQTIIFDGSTVANISNTTASQTWHVETRVCREAVGKYNNVGIGMTTGNGGVVGQNSLRQTTNSTVDFTTNRVMTCNCQNGTGTQGSCSFIGFKVMYEPGVAP
jgi:hypothetical protein